MGHQTQARNGIKKGEVEKRSGRLPGGSGDATKLSHTENKLAKPERGACSAPTIQIRPGPGL